MKQHTGNWPGKTVASAVGVCKYKNKEFLLVDIPGTYSVMSNSEEEEIARDYICFGNPKVTVVILDATSLEKNLNLVYQIMEITDNVIVCVNLLDEAKKKGISIDFTELEKRLGVPVVGVIARKKKTLNKLIETIDKVCNEEINLKPNKIDYPPYIENCVERLEEKINKMLTKESKRLSRWICLKLIDGDQKILRNIEKNLKINLINNKELINEKEEISDILKFNGIEQSDVKDKMISSIIFRAENMMLSYTAAKEGVEPVEKALKSIKHTLHQEKCEEETRCILHCTKKNEGFKTSSKVQYVARVGNFIDGGAKYHGALQILKVILSYDYLWQNIRVKGGAYGCMSNFNRIGEAYLISYRDPNLKKTMQIYEDVVEYLKNFTVDDRDMTKYIIGTISNIDRPMNPAAKGERSLNLYMNHVSEEMIRKEREEILSAKQEDIRNLAEVVQAMLDAKQLCVIGSEEKIEAEKEMFQEVRVLF